MSDFKGTELWKAFEQKADENNKGDFVTAVKTVCESAIKSSKSIIITFPMFTLHDETHIVNVMDLMYKLIGEKNCQNNFTYRDLAMLLMSASCHDIGMSFSENELNDIFTDNTFICFCGSKYELYKSKYENDLDNKEFKKIIREFVRKNHHNRVQSKITSIWNNEINEEHIKKTDLIAVCQSHGENIETIKDKKFDNVSVDLRSCAILLRLADILDFDTSRTPDVLYNYIDFENKTDSEAIKSKEEWDKHLSSYGFDFDNMQNNILPYSAECEKINIEYSIKKYINWVNTELSDCNYYLNFLNLNSKFTLPYKIDMKIDTIGYKSGDFTLALDKDRVLSLLSGESLYGDPAVFVRELLQNAIDAVLAMDKINTQTQSKPANWQPEINISSWIDNEGYHWFRIDDNGMGMNEEIITKYFLNAGNSYYNSEDFEQIKLENQMKDYGSISRFGIGILSCFMNKENILKLSTLHYKDNSNKACRLTMNGLTGYYALSTPNENQTLEPLPSYMNEDKSHYRNECGTSIAVRTDLLNFGKYKGFKEIVDKYLAFPPVKVTYKGEDGEETYTTEEEFTKAVHDFNYSEDLEKDGCFEIDFPEDIKQQILKDYSFLELREDEIPTKIEGKLVDLSRYTCSDSLKGAILNFKEIIIERYDKNTKSKKLIFELKDTKFGNFYVTCSWDYSSDSRKNETYKFNPKIYLNNTLNEMLHKNDFMYNGVKCDEDIFNDPSSIILLNKNYRPDVNIARNTIQELPIELLCDFSLINHKLNKQNYIVEQNLEYRYRYRYRYGYRYRYKFNLLSEYFNILEKRNDFSKMLTVKTNNGIKNLSDLASNDYVHFSFDEIYDSLCIATLLKNKYHLEYDYNIELQQSLFRIKNSMEKTFDIEKLKLFPPMLFMKYPDKFKNSFRLSSAIYNIDHPLSQFLIKNSETLNEKANGIFKRFISVLYGHISSSNDINPLIDNLKLINQKRNLGIYIPDNIYLKDEDFIF